MELTGGGDGVERRAGVATPADIEWGGQGSSPARSPARSTGVRPRLVAGAAAAAVAAVAWEMRA